MHLDGAARFGIAIDHRSDEASRLYRVHERDRPLEGHDGRVHVGAAFEPCRRFGFEPETLARFPD